MNVLFDCFKYTDEYYDKIEKGLVSREDDCDLERDCYREKILLNLMQLKAARPADNGKYTEACCEGDTYYILAVSFNDFLRICPHNTYATLKSKWAN